MTLMQSDHLWHYNISSHYFNATEEQSGLINNVYAITTIWENYNKSDSC